MRPNFEAWNHELLALAEETERLAGRMSDEAVKSRLREIAAEVRQMAKSDERHGDEWPPGPGATEAARARCLLV